MDDFKLFHGVSLKSGEWLKRVLIIGLEYVVTLLSHTDESYELNDNAVYMMCHNLILYSLITWYPHNK